MPMDSLTIPYRLPAKFLDAGTGSLDTALLLFLQQIQGSCKIQCQKLHTRQPGGGGGGGCAPLAPVLPAPRFPRFPNTVHGIALSRH